MILPSALISSRLSLRIRNRVAGAVGQYQRAEPAKMSRSGMRKMKEDHRQSNPVGFGTVNPVARGAAPAGTSARQNQEVLSVAVERLRRATEDGLNSGVQTEEHDPSYMQEGEGVAGGSSRGPVMRTSGGRRRLSGRSTLLVSPVG